MADRIPWSDDLLTHIEAIDNDHRKLFALANALFASVSLGNDAVNLAYGELWTYTKAHFGREEESMTSAGYGGLADHRKDHNNLVLQLDYLTERLARSETAAVGDDFVKFLESWLKTHIMSFDRQFSDYLRAKQPAK